MRLLLLFLLSLTSIFADQLDIKKKNIKFQKLKDGTYNVKIAFNYKKSTHISQKIKGVNGIYNLHFPIPESWQVLSLKGYLHYTPSILLQKEHSASVIKINNTTIKQFKLFKYSTKGVNFSIEKNSIKKYNILTIEMIQHYTDKDENTQNSQLWTEIDLQNSYLEFHIKKLDARQKIASISTLMLDPKQYHMQPINYILSQETTDKELFNYALLTGKIANSVGKRVIKLSTSHSIEKKKHNILITTKENIKKKLSDLEPYFLLKEEPIYSLHFNNQNLEPILNQGISLSSKGSKLMLQTKKAFYDKSLYLYGGNLILDNIPFNDNENFTISLWIKPDKKRHRTTLFKFDNYKLVLNKRYIGFNTDKNNLYGGKLRISHKWHHIVATFNSQNIKKNSIYIDGKKIRLHRIFGKFSSPPPSFTPTAIIGGDNKKSFYSGSIDQLYLFNKALSEQTIKKIYRLSKQNLQQLSGESIFISEKILKDINVIQNPFSPDKIIIIIAPKQEKHIVETLYQFCQKDLALYLEQGLNIDTINIPKKMPKYSAKGYLQVEKKIYLNSLGYQTTLLKGISPNSININFKIYPDHYFNSKDRITTNIEYQFPSTVSPDSVANIFLNNKFADQIIIDKYKKEERSLPVSLLNKGSNTIRFEFSFFKNNLVSLFDTSYFTLPSSSRWIEMPYLQYFADSGYPYSIYPDLQETQILLTDTDNDTVSASMNFLYFLSQEIQNIPYHISIINKIEDIDKNRHLIVFGSIYDEELNKLKDITSFSILKQKQTLHKNIVLEMIQSPFNNQKTVLLFLKGDLKNLDSSLHSLLSPLNRHYIQGDKLVYNPLIGNGIYKNIHKKYILTDMNFISKIRLQIGLNPVLYISVLIIFITLLTLYIRSLLLDLKRKNHPYVE